MLRQSGTIVSRYSPLSSFLRHKPLPLNHTARTAPFKQQSRNIFAAIKFFTTPKAEVTGEPADVKKIRPESHLRPEGINGEKIIYRGDSGFTIRAMFGAGVVNLIYWTYYLVNCYVYADVVIQGIDFGGQPAIAFFGYAGTALVFYCNREYASHSAHMVYETPDGRRLGFQMHNMMGFPGKKIEANIGNVRLANTVSYNLGSDSFVPLRVEGISNNVLLDKDGLFYADGRLKFLLEAGGTGKAGSKKRVVVDDSSVKGTWAYKMKNRKMRKDETKST